MEKKIRNLGAGLLAAVWLALTVFAWFGPRRDISQAERRPLAQLPQLNTAAVLDGSYMASFGEFALDQFPLRDEFRTLKSLVHRYGLQQKDNNGIYIAQGHAAQLEYPMDQDSLTHALAQLEAVYDRYLEPGGCRVYSAVIPDKGFYLAEAHGYPAMDYAALFAQFQEDMPWATYVDISEQLTIDDYYRTDTHWRQEAIGDVAQVLAQAMGVTALDNGVAQPVTRPFYGVYYGQAALPMAADTMYLVESPVLDGCRVYNYVTDTWGTIYDLPRLEGRDMYEVYLSGAQSLLRIENPNAATDRELVVFRDSFASSLVPLLMQDYRVVTLIDIRYIPVPLLGKYVTFDGQDVLMIYSTTVLNRKLI